MSTAATVLGAALAAAMLQFMPNIAGSAFDLPSLDWSISTYAGAAALAAGVGAAEPSHRRRGAQLELF